MIRDLQDESNNLIKEGIQYQYALLKKEEQEGKTGLFQSGYQWKVGGHKERRNKSEYGGCILYLYMKIEERNLLKLF
jgi:hypothetical protein